MSSRIEEINKQIAKLQHEKEELEANELVESKLHPEIKRYKQTNFGSKLLETYSLDTYGVWEIKGEDPNADFGGSHYEPHLGYLEGKLENVILEAITMKRFYTWGSGGSIIKIEKPLIKKV